MPTTTSRLGLQVPATTDLVSNGPVSFAQFLGVLDSAGLYKEGTLANRGTAGGTIKGTWYRATDTGQWFRYTGTAWIQDSPTVVSASGTQASFSAAQFGRLLRATDTKQWLLDNGSTLDQLSFVGGGYGPLKYVNVVNVNHNAAPGEFIVCAGNINIYLPAPTVNAWIAVFPVGNSGSNPIAVVAGAGGSNIVAPGMVVATVGLGTGDVVTHFFCDGTNWLVSGGALDTGWQTIGLGGNGTAGAVAPAFRRIGNRVEMRGLLNVTTSVPTGAGLVGPFPSAYIPTGGTAPSIGYTAGPGNPGSGVSSPTFLDPGSRNFLAAKAMVSGWQVYFDGTHWMLD